MNQGKRRRLEDKNVKCFNCGVELTKVPEGTKEPACCIKCWLEAYFRTEVN
jgi:hypothetical protein